MLLLVVAMDKYSRARTEVELHRAACKGNLPCLLMS